MKSRILGSTDLIVSELGFGTWGLSGVSYGPVDDAESIRTLKRAFDLGITFFDTADIYGEGRCERILHEALGQVRDKIIIATKGGTLPHSTFAMPQDFSSTYLRAALEKSLSRLDSDYIDLYQLHSPNIDQIDLAGVLGALEKFKLEGKIRHYGISVRSPQDALKLIQDFGVQVIQTNLNLIDQRAMDCGLLDCARKANVGIIARTPLCFGFLTGRVSQDTEFMDGDHRKLWPIEQLKRWSDAVPLFRPLYGINSRTPVDLALRFCLSNDSVSTVIPGMMNVAEVEQNVQSINYGRLSSTEVDAVTAIYKAHEFYDRNAKGL